MATPNDTPAPTKPLMAGCQQEPCSAVLALKRLQARFRHLYKTAGERWQEAEKRGDLAAMQENACEKSAYVQAAMEVTNEIDLLNRKSAMRPGNNMEAKQDQAPAELAALACYATASESGICPVCDGVGLEEMVINERVKIIPCGRCGGTGDAEIIASRSHSDPAMPTASEERPQA